MNITILTLKIKQLLSIFSKLEWFAAEIFVVLPCHDDVKLVKVNPKKIITSIERHEIFQKNNKYENFNLKFKENILAFIYCFNEQKFLYISELKKTQITTFCKVIFHRDLKTPFFCFSN